MNSSHPPAIADWLLDHLYTGAASESLRGDLLEEYAGGRSNSWYWRQALAAIVVSTIEDAREHWLLTLRGVFTGWSLFHLFQLLVWAMMRRFHGGVPLYFKMQEVLGHGIVICVFWLIIWPPIWMITGWNLGKLHRIRLTGTVLAFSFSVLAWNLLGIPATIHFLIDSRTDARYIPQIVVELMNLVLPPILVVIGGLLAGTGDRQHSLERIRILP